MYVGGPIQSLCFWKCLFFFLPSLLNNNLTEYKSVGWQLFYFSMLRICYYIVFWPQLLLKISCCQPYYSFWVFFVFFSLVGFRSFFLSLVIFTFTECVKFCPQSVLSIRGHMFFAIMKILSPNLEIFLLHHSLHPLLLEYLPGIGWSLSGIFHVC